MTSNYFTCDRPEELLLIPIALLVVFLAGLNWSQKRPSLKNRQLTCIRCVVVSLLCLAVCGLRWHSRTSRLTTIFVVDVSDSVSRDERMNALQFINRSLRFQRAGDMAGLVVFGGEPFLEDAPTQNLDTTHFAPDVPTDSTNIESALDAASGALSNPGGRRIVLFTDGLENSGNARNTIAGLQQQGVQVDIAPTMLSQSELPEALVNRIATPSHAAINEPIPIRIVASSNIEQTAGLVLERSGKRIAQLIVTLHPGKNLMETEDTISRPGQYQYTVSLAPSADTFPQNNTANSVVLVSGSPRILYLRSGGEQPASSGVDALRVQGFDVAEESPSNAPTTVVGLADYDSIILSDVGAGDLSPSQMDTIEKANRDFGVGLGMVGGLDSFGAGGYANTPVEDALPVKMLPKDKSRIPAADVVIVLDASGSMSAEENGVEKVEIAARAALNLLKALKPGDRVAVLAVTETPELVMPLVSPAKAADYVPSIEAVSAGGGGIDCRNGLEAAYTLLETSNATIKHVIICPDTTDSEQQEGCVALATAVYNSSKISTSVCGIGNWDDSDVPFQRSLATAGHGQLYVADQAGNLPLFFQRDVQNVEQKLYDEGDFVVEDVVGKSFGGVSTRFPDLLGYNMVDAKPSATVALELGSHHDPLLTYWHNGLGRSFAFASDDQAHWATRWMSWPGYAPFWAHVVRWSLKSGEDNSFQVLVTSRDGLGHVVVDAFTTSGFAVNSQFQATIAGPDNSEITRNLVETAPGRYETDFATSSVGSYVTRIDNVLTGGSRTETVSTPYPLEYADLQPNTELLGEFAHETGGRFLTIPEQAFRRQSAWNLGATSLVQDLLLTSAFIFLLDIAWRRLGWRLDKGLSAKVGRDVRERTNSAVTTLRTKASVDAGRLTNLERPPMPIDNDLLRRRTAARADFDEDDPFPYVKALPPRPRKESKHTVSKDNK